MVRSLCETALWVLFYSLKQGSSSGVHSTVMTFVGLGMLGAQWGVAGSATPPRPLDAQVKLMLRAKLVVYVGTLYRGGSG